MYVHSFMIEQVVMEYDLEDLKKSVLKELMWAKTGQTMRKKVGDRCDVIELKGGDLKMVMVIGNET
jgi:hypothetical protein